MMGGRRPASGAGSYFNASSNPRVAATGQLNDIRLRLERALTVPMMRTRGMAAQIIAHGDLSLPVFNRVAEVLLRGHPAIRNIGVSRGTKLEMLYPLAGNEAVLGVDYRDIAWQWPGVRRAIEVHSPVVQGPMALLQGGSGLIIRDPVFLSDTSDGRERLFGVVSLVLNMQEIYSEAGLTRDNLPIEVAIRGRDGLGEAGELIRGDASVFASHPVELDVQFPNGRWRLAAIPKAGWGDPDGKVLLSRLMGGAFFLFVVAISFGVARHIIERRQLLDQVGMSEERFRNLLRIASDGIHILDESGNLVMCSDSFLRMLGYSEAEARTLTVADWEAVFSREELSVRVRDLIHNPAVFETRHRRRDNTEIDVEINACGITLGGKAHLYASARDISERKLHENELRIARSAAESAAQAKSNFLATMSHEIRTPVTSVMAVADLMQRTPLTEEQDGYLKILKSATGTLLTVLNDVLDISKIESGKVVIEAAEFSLHEAVREAIALGQTGASAKGLSIGLAISEGLPDRVIGDSTRVRQVLFNLISNAVKFTEQGSITVRLLVRERKGQRAVVLFEIEDTGIGIDRGQIDQLFAAFSQADATTTRRFGGTGLGLAISKKLVELMGGRIGVESETGVGSLFWFSLPLKVADRYAPAPGPSPVAPAGSEPPTRPLRILLAEDNRINQMLVQSMLQKFGHSVHVVENGRQALEAVIGGEFDVVLMDMQMPEVDGEEATRAIRALPAPKSEIPVLALTADVMAEHRARYLQAGVDDLVAKPIDWRVLSELVRLHTDAGGPARRRPDTPPDPA